MQEEINYKPEQIRKRKSYGYFKEWLQYFKQPRTDEEIMMKIHSIIDCYRGFHSATNSYYAEQSIKQIVEDNKQEKKPNVFFIQEM